VIHINDELPRKNIKAVFPLCLVEEIPIGHSRGFDPENTGRDVIFVVHHQNQFYAYYNACPHRGYEGTTLCWRRHAFLDKTGQQIVCSGHGACFAIDTGQCVIGPCLGTALKKTSIHVDNGWLYWYKNKD